MASRLRATGRFAESLGPLKRAVQLGPANALVLHDLGLTYLECGQIEEAIAALRRAVALNVCFAPAYFRLGVALELKGDLVEAFQALKRAVALSPSLAPAHARLGRLFKLRGDFAEAGKALRAAARAAPDTKEGRITLAEALFVEGNHFEATKALQRVLARDPKSGRAQFLLGSVLSQTGKFEEAEAAFAEAIKFGARKGMAYYRLAHCRKLGEADRPLIEQMLGVARELRLPLERALLQFAVGKAFDDLGEYRSAIKHFDEANRLKSSVVPFDRDALARRVDALIARFTPDFFAAQARWASDSELPILVLGMPRSGTTLVEQIISSHRFVAGAGELLFWDQRGRIFGQIADAQIADFQLRTAQDCLTQLHALAPDALRVIDKLPFNFLWAGLIRLVFPRATIVHCRRDPVDTCLSMFSTYFDPRADFSTDRGDLVFYYGQYTRLMAHWRRVLSKDRFIEVSYERLIANPEPVSRALMDACGLDWDTDCLQPERNKRPVKTSSVWQVRQPIFQSSVERWRRYEPWLGELRELQANST